MKMWKRFKFYFGRYYYGTELQRRVYTSNLPVFIKKLVSLCSKTKYYEEGRKVPINLGSAYKCSTGRFNATSTQERPWPKDPEPVVIKERDAEFNQ